MDDPLKPTWDNVFYPPDLKDYTYFREPMTDANRKGWMADAAVLAYNRSRSQVMDPAIFRSQFLGAGFEDVKLVEAADPLSDTQMYFARRPQLAILSFCGTVKGNLKNLLTDFDALPESESGVIVHRGFSEALDIVWADAKGFLEAYRAKYPTSPIYFTGHSLGGALATLAIWRFQNGRGDANVSLHTIGCPRVGNGQFCKEVRERATQGIFRYMDGNDVVTHVPPAGPPIGYAHPDDGIQVGVGEWQRTGETERIVREAPAIVWDLITGRPPDDLADHSPARYLYYLWR